MLACEYFQKQTLLQAVMAVASTPTIILTSLIKKLKTLTVKTP
jgi:4-hydroxy-3-methylbut-2-enyl diphosphate reductase IspH